jgi:hypothetical protein
MKGWQYRWFVLDDNAGLLSYYTVCFVDACVQFIFVVSFEKKNLIFFF